MNRVALLAVLAVSNLTFAHARDITGMRSLALSPDGTQLAFTWRGDIWTAPSTGGRATPLTTNVEMDDNPIWSPDGQWIAFATNRNGNWDTYVTPADGGEVKRLTYSSFTEVPNGWTPDGKRLIYRGFYEKSENGVYSMDVATGQIQEHWVDHRALGFPKISPDGKEALFVRRYSFPFTRPRYEGSSPAQLNVLDLVTGKRTEVRANRFQHLWPTFAPDGKSFFAVTVTEKTPSSHNIFEKPTVYTDDADKTPNVYRIARSGQATRLTNFVGGSGARFLSVAEKSGTMAFERDGVAYTLASGQEPKALKFTASIDDKTAIEERLVLTTGPESLTLSPKAERIVFAIRRELWSVPIKKGKGPNADDATQLTTWEGTDESPIFTPDEKFIFFVSDRQGGKRVYRMNVETQDITPVTTTDHNCFGLSLTPDKKRIAFWMTGDKVGGLYTAPVEGGTATRILDRPHAQDYAFSPDMKYLAYVRDLLGSGFNPWENKRNILVRELATGKETNVTNLSANHLSPAWSIDGKYLYFQSDREGGGLFALPLQAESARSFELELKFEKPKEPAKLDFDLVEPYFRIRKLYAGPVSGNLVTDPTNGALYFLANGDIWTLGYDGEGARAITAGGGIGGFELSQDTNQLFFIKAGVMTTLNLRAPNTPSAAVGFRADWTRDLRAERRAAYRELWQVYNQQFYDPNFHGRNWLAIRPRNEVLLDGVGHRNEMATILNMMIGELETSHAEVGPAGGNPGSTSTAHLGFTFDYSHSGPGIKVATVPRRTPGSFPQTQIKPGDYVMTINGKDVRTDQSLWRVLNDQTGRDLILTVNATPTKTGARTIKYRSISDGSFDEIEYRNRIAGRRATVDKASGGTFGYVHIAAMGGGDFSQFDAEVWQYVQGKKGLIIDVRDNNGGNIADRLLDILERRKQMLYVPRDGEIQTGPGTVVEQPIVVLFNERSVSNGEMFPAAMKSRKLATTVGYETPGYVIYTYGGSLVDGTSIRLPNTGVYRIDGSPLENGGEKPEFKVDLTPEQFLSGQDPQLAKGIEVLRSKVK